MLEKLVLQESRDRREEKENLAKKQNKKQNKTNWAVFLFINWVCVSGVCVCVLMFGTVNKCIWSMYVFMCVCEYIQVCVGMHVCLCVSTAGQRGGSTAGRRCALQSASPHGTG